MASTSIYTVQQQFFFLHLTLRLPRVILFRQIFLGRPMGRYGHQRHYFGNSGNTVVAVCCVVLFESVLADTVEAPAWAPAVRVNVCNV